MFPQTEDFYRLAPEIVLCITGILVMVMEPFLPAGRRQVSGALALLGAIASLASTFYMRALPGKAFHGLLAIDGFSFFFHVLVGTVAVLVILSSGEYLEREQLRGGEYYALVMFATAGMGVMASAQELVTAFIGLEMSSISSYILASYRRDAPKANESAMKYFLLGSFATAFFLYGIALLYGGTGTTFLPQMNDSATGSHLTLVRLGLALVFVGLAFKVAAAPFQVWTPDVYEGAPTPVTALFSAGPKAAAFALLLRILATVTAAQDFWFWALWIAAVLTMFVGNLGALVQTSLKRMLAYSSIAHAGYILVAFAARSEIGLAAVLYYLLAYALMKVGAFTIVGHLGGTGERHLEIEDYAGLGQRQPLTAAALSLFLLSLLGLPITAGFLGKFYIFKAALDSGLIWLAILMAINSVIGAYYYLRVIVVMYMREPQEAIAKVRVPAPVAAVLVFAAAATVYLGLFPNRVMGFVSQAGLLQR
ncbi:MAG TPA: NADH-quinone oxidoreductase subunit N [Candidatus Acidoferrales bacterium]|nr:NADH-quinone oxidoreductase subunit N [Candidatus Acidoferrales bacterium]